MAALAAVCIAFAALAAVDLENVRPVSGDDAIIVSVSARLAERAVLGSPLHEGFAGAGDHYFLNLPLQHVLQAGAFRLFGAGIAQARLVSLVAAVVLLIVTTLLAARWFGRRVAATTAAALVLWRSGLVGLDYGLPLLAVARSARYDITAVALLWVAILAFDSLIRRPSRGIAFVTGLLAAAAMLTQFHGWLVLPALAALWVARSGPRTARVPYGAWIATGLLTGLAAYTAYFAAHATDAMTQIRVVHAARVVDGPTGLLSSVATEPLRFAAAARQRGIGQLGLLVAIAGIPFLLWRSESERPVRDGTQDSTRLLLLVLVALLVPLALLERTKAALYALPLLPALCMLLALVLDALWRYTESHARATTRVLRAAIVLAAAALVAEGAVALFRDRIAAMRVSAYQDVAATIDAAIDTDAAVAGPAQWAWGLRRRTYVDIGAVALRQRVAAVSGESMPALESVLRGYGVRYLIVNDDLRGELRRAFHGPEFSGTLISVLDRCTRMVLRWIDPTYGTLEIRALLPVCPE